MCGESWWDKRVNDGRRAGVRRSRISRGESWGWLVSELENRWGAMGGSGLCLGVLPASQGA